MTELSVFGHVLRLMITSSFGKKSPLTVCYLFGIQIVNPFVSSAPFLCLRRISENREVFQGFQGLAKGCIGNKWIKMEYIKSGSVLYFPVLVGNVTI